MTTMAAPLPDFDALLAEHKRTHPRQVPTGKTVEELLEQLSLRSSVQSLISPGILAQFKLRTAAQQKWRNQRKAQLDPAAKTLPCVPLALAVTKAAHSNDSKAYQEMRNAFLDCVFTHTCKEEYDALVAKAGNATNMESHRAHPVESGKLLACSERFLREVMQKTKN